MAHRLRHAALIRRFAPPSPAGGRRAGTTHLVAPPPGAGEVGGMKRGLRAAFRGKRPHPALRATFSRRREKGWDAKRLVAPLPEGWGTTRLVAPLPDAGEGWGTTRLVAPLPRAGEGWGEGLGHAAGMGVVFRGKRPHPALRATFSRRREKGWGRRRYLFAFSRGGRRAGAGRFFSSLSRVRAKGYEDAGMGPPSATTAHAITPLARFLR